MTSRPLSDELLLGSGGLVWITFDNASGHRAISGLELVLESEVHSRAMLGQAIVDLRATSPSTRPGPGGFASVRPSPDPRFTFPMARRTGSDGLSSRSWSTRSRSPALKQHEMATTCGSTSNLLPPR